MDLVKIEFFKPYRHNVDNLLKVDLFKVKFSKPNHHDIGDFLKVDFVKSDLLVEYNIE